MMNKSIIDPQENRIIEAVLLNDDKLYMLYREQLKSLRAQIIDACKECDKGNIVKYVEGKGLQLTACSCLKKYRKLARLIKAGIPINKLLNIWDDDGFFEKKCIRFKVNRYVTGEKITYTHSVAQKGYIYKNHINKFIENKRYAKGKSFVFLGSNGCGKTASAIDMMSQVLEQDQNNKAYYILTRNLVDLYLNTERWAKKENAEWLTDHIKKCDFLIIDELGKEVQFSKIKEDAQIILENVIKFRVDNQLSTVLITNYSIDEMLHKYTDSIISILNEAYDFILLDSRFDYRFDSVDNKKSKGED